MIVDIQTQDTKLHTHRFSDLLLVDQIVLTTTTTKFSEIKTLKPMLLPSVKSKLMNKLTVKHAVTNKDQIQKLKKAIIKKRFF